MILRFLSVLSVCLFTIGVAYATSSSFTVSGGEETTRTLNLEVDDRVMIKFTVVGSSDSSLYFYISYPNGTAKEFGKVGVLSYSFVCDLKGEYVLHFSNEYSTEDKLVTLDYEVQHYIFGIPQMLFLVIIIAVVCVAAVAVFILMGKPR